MRTVMRRLVLAALLCAGASVPGAGAGVTVTYETQGRALFSLAVPDDWKVLVGFEVSDSETPTGKAPLARIVSVLPHEGDPVMWTGFWSPAEVQQIEDARGYFERVAPRFLAEAEVTFREDRVVNGMVVRVVSGVGKREERDFDFAIAALQIAPDRVAFAAFIGEPAAHDLYESTLIGIFNSIRPVGEAP